MSPDCPRVEGRAAVDLAAVVVAPIAPAADGQRMGRAYPGPNRSSLQGILFLLGLRPGPLRVRYFQTAKAG